MRGWFNHYRKEETFKSSLILCFSGSIKSYKKDPAQSHKYEKLKALKKYHNRCGKVGSSVKQISFSSE